MNIGDKVTIVKWRGKNDLSVFDITGTISDISFNEPEDKCFLVNMDVDKRIEPYWENELILTSALPPKRPRK